MRAVLLIVAMLGAYPAEEPREQTRCHYRGERTSGLNKICYYRCVSGEAAITIKAYRLCPLSIER